MYFGPLNFAANTESQVKIAEAGGIQAIIEGMGMHRENKEVQEEGCWALVNLASNNAANKASIEKEGGIDVARKAYDTHRISKAKELIELLFGF